VTEALHDPTDLPRILEIAQATARLAGDYLLQKRGSVHIISHKSTRDDVLDADVEAERLILAALQEETPTFGTLSEETGQRGNTDHYWIIDPLDGSTNFQHGSPLFAVSIAFATQQGTGVGVIYLPTADEMFVASQHQGAYLNGKPIHVSPVSVLNEAIAHIGDFTKADDIAIIPERLKELSKLAMQARRVRMIGTAATDLAYVACGRADILINHADHLWDIEAGKLLLQEAGGKATSKLYPEDAPLAIYTNGILHQTVEHLFD
jgi:myo-inositol-1(or 4)-monophosphatase